MNYNTTALTSSAVDNFARFLWELNDMSNNWLAYVLLGLLFSVALFSLMNYGYTIWTSLPISLLMISILATLFRIITVNNIGMINTYIVIPLWVLTAIMIGVRTAIKE